MNPKMIPAMYESYMDRFLGLQEGRDEAIEEAREHGAEAAATELLKAAKRSSTNAAREPDDWRTRTFISHFCGGIENAFPELAREIAKGSGMAHLYPEE